MASFNKVILAGNLTRDPELRYTPKGTAVAKFGIAMNRRWKAETGEMKEETTFVDVEAWDRQGEVVGQYFRKGSAILVEGRLRYDAWDDKQTGQKRSRLVVRLESFSFLDSKGSGPDMGGSPVGPSAPAEAPRARTAAPAAPAPIAEPAEVDAPPSDDDVPF